MPRVQSNGIEISYKERGQGIPLVLISSWARCDKYTITVFESSKKMRNVSTPDDFV
jgi:hypothetical protein